LLTNDNCFQFSDVASLASTEDGFSIKWQQVFRTHQYNFQNATKLKSISKCTEKISNSFFGDLANFSKKKTGILQQTIRFCFLIFTFQQNFTPKENTVMY
jgi:hypothetical protein